MSLRSEVVRIFNELLGDGKKITELPAASTITGTELIEAVQGGVNVKVIVSAISGGGGTSITAWDKTTNLFPSGSNQWQIYYGTGATTRVDRSGNTLPSDPIIAISLVNNASTTDPTEWAFIYTLV